MGAATRKNRFFRNSLTGVVACVAACSDGAPSIPLEVGGTWNLNSNVSEVSARCALTGILSLDQETDLITGSYSLTKTCSTTATNPSSINLNLTGIITDGLVIENTLKFDIGRCRYSGSISEAEAATINGTILCTYVSLAAKVSTESGSWFAGRLTH